LDKYLVLPGLLAIYPAAILDGLTGVYERRASQAHVSAVVQRALFGL